MPIRVIFKRAVCRYPDGIFSYKLEKLYIFCVVNQREAIIKNAVAVFFILIKVQQIIFFFTLQIDYSATEGSLYLSKNFFRDPHQMIAGKWLPGIVRIFAELSNQKSGHDIGIATFIQL